MMASRGLSCVRSSYASGTNLHVVGEGASTTRQWQAAATVQICSNGGGRRRRRIDIRQAARSRLRWCARAEGSVGRFPSQVQHGLAARSRLAWQTEIHKDTQCPSDKRTEERRVGKEWYHPCSYRWRVYY